MNIELKGMITEKRNLSTINIDRVSTYEMVKIMNQEDKLVPYAVEKELDNIAKVIDSVYIKLKNGGRLIYCGAGTSGRLGILDAVECVPTYSVNYDKVMGIIAGGNDAVFKSKEGAEDNYKLCEEDLKEIEFNENDFLVGLTASGRTPYVIGGLIYARSIGAGTATITCNLNSKVNSIADITITPIVGEEIITGSTRMKSGTAQKLVLNMISTGVMIKLGKVYENLMVDLKPSNMKLIERAKNILMDVSDISYEKAVEILEITNYDVKLAVIVAKTGIEVEKARKLLNECDGHISKSIEKIFI